MKAEIKKAMSRRLINSPEEAEQAVEFVLELLELQIEHTEKTEPYAKNWIYDAKKACSKVSDLTQFLEINGI